MSNFASKQRRKSKRYRNIEFQVETWNGNRKSVQNFRNLQCSLENVKFYVETAIIVEFPIECSRQWKIISFTLFLLSEKKENWKFYTLAHWFLIIKVEFFFFLLLS